PLIVAALLPLSVTEARVTFTNSEVLQASDFAWKDNVYRAAFKCDNGCSAYTDSRANNLYITEYDGNVYKAIVNFSNMGGNVRALPDPYKLNASNSYYIEDRGEKKPYDFVFYVVDRHAPNADTPVMVIDDDWGIDGNGEERLFTILSSKYDSVRYDQFAGGFQKGFPRIYSTGFDAVAEKECRPLYQASSQESASLSSITVFSPISTVEYGNTEAHNMHVAWNKDNSFAHNIRSSTVYSSPGYVGCSYTIQSYSSSIDKIEDGFFPSVISLDINGVYDQVTKDETVLLRVDEIILDFNGTGTLEKHFFYPSPFPLACSMSWQRKTATARWAVQMDFGMGEPNPAVSSTTLKAESTTSSGFEKAFLVSIIVSIIALF
ncbi:hypothetical protein PMAYCL1PPCAC_00380, partial [Pristionchus mayeri]